MFASMLIALINFYQQTLSPDHGPLRHLYPYGFCTHDETCSSFAKRVIARHGALIGMILTIKRLLSCHPWRKPSERKILKITNVQP